LSEQYKANLAFKEKMKELINSVNFERKECYLYLKNGLTLFLKGAVRCTDVGVEVKDIRERSIFRYSAIAGFKVLTETIPKEKKIEFDEEDAEASEVDLEEMGAQAEAEREGYDDR